MDILGLEESSKRDLKQYKKLFPEYELVLRKEIQRLTDIGEDDQQERLKFLLEKLNKI